MAAEELQGVIESVEVKRHKLEQHQPATKDLGKLLTLLPRAAEEYRQQITPGLAGDRNRVQSARLILCDLLGGEITLSSGEMGRFG